MIGRDANPELAEVAVGRTVRSVTSRAASYDRPLRGQQRLGLMAAAVLVAGRVNGPIIGSGRALILGAAQAVARRDGSVLGEAEAWRFGSPCGVAATAVPTQARALTEAVWVAAGGCVEVSGGWVRPRLAARLG